MEMLRECSVCEKPTDCFIHLQVEADESVTLCETCLLEFLAKETTITQVINDLGALHLTAVEVMKNSNVGEDAEEDEMTYVIAKLKELGCNGDCENCNLPEQEEDFTPAAKPVPAATPATLDMSKFFCMECGLPHNECNCKDSDDSDDSDDDIFCNDCGYTYDDCICYDDDDDDDDDISLRCNTCGDAPHNCGCTDTQIDMRKYFCMTCGLPHNECTC